MPGVFLYVLRVTALTQGLTEPEALLFPTPTTPHFTDKTSWVCMVTYLFF